MRIARTLLQTPARSPPRPDATRLRAAEALRDARDALTRGEPQRALAAFDAALERDPRLALARGGRLMCLAAMGRDEDFSQAMEHEIASGDASAILELARMCAAQGRAQLALEILGIVVANAPHATRAMIGDAGLASLRDHPIFLQLTGQL